MRQEELVKASQSKGMSGGIFAHGCHTPTRPAAYLHRYHIPLVYESSPAAATGGFHR